MKRDEIINFLRSNKEFLSKNMGVKSIALFGSYAKGTANEQSDIDILVELKEAKYEWMYKLQIYLEQNLNHKIDLIRYGPHLREKFLTSIKKELTYA
jgi:predicted nucleotidyltransferase